MNNEVVGAVQYDAKINTSQLKSSATQADSIVRDSVNKTDGAIKKSTQSMKNSLDSVPGSIAAIGGAYLSIQGLKTFLTESVNEANRFQASMLGLTTVANAFGQSSGGAREAARQLAADGLMPLADAATSLKNLLATGFSLDEAITLITRFKDTAAFGRQSALAFGESIRGATEGIKNGNSILVDNAGVTKNLSVILQEAGKSQQDVMNITSDASVRQALYTGLLRETNAQLGDASRLAQTAAGSDSRLATETQYLMARVGELANTIRQPLVNGLTEFIATNQQAIITIGSGVVAFAGFAGGAYLGVKAIGVLKLALTSLIKHPAIAILGAVFGLFAGAVIDNMISGLEESGDKMFDFGDATGGAAENVKGLTKESGKLEKQLSKIDDQIAKTNRDFNESLAEMVRGHQDTIKSITKQLKDENADYKKAYDDRLSKFSKEQSEEAKTHQSKVSKLQAQIDFLRRYSNASNRTQLSELEFALAKENNEYATKFAERQAKYDEDAAYEKSKHDERTLDLQTRLNAETALLDKHAVDVASIRDVILLDEIEKLKRSRNEQLASLKQQRLDAIEGNARTGAAGGQAFSDAYLSKLNNMNTKAIGKTKSVDFMQSLVDEVSKVDWIRKAQDNFARNWEANGGDFFKPMKDSLKRTMDFSIEVGKHSNPTKGLFKVFGFSSGGFTGRGGVDEPAGIVHRGEYVLPQRLVNQSTGLPDLDALVGSSSSPASSTSTVVNVNLSGIMTSSAADERAIAKRLIERVNEELRAKGRQEIGVAA
jgi:hypothetical protein